MFTAALYQYCLLQYNLNNINNNNCNNNNNIYNSDTDFAQYCHTFLFVLVSEWRFNVPLDIL